MVFLNLLSSFAVICLLLWSSTVYGHLCSSLVVFRRVSPSFAFGHHSRSFAIFVRLLLSFVMLGSLWSSFDIFGRFFAVLSSLLRSLVVFHGLSLFWSF